MPIQPDLITLEMAKYVSDYVLRRGGWLECTPEAVLERASSIEELHKWIGIATGDKIQQFPKNPKHADRIYVSQCGTSYFYLYLKGEWSLVDAMPAHLRFMY